MQASFKKGDYVWVKEDEGTRLLMKLLNDGTNIQADAEWVKYPSPRPFIIFKPGITSDGNWEIVRKAEISFK